ncbi:MAG: flagellar assembly protein FliW [Alphaproteobacteria bacterium]|jgi:flagellar assembly factor FliW|nr:flagellar assembly protein FliW [Alphaproteobacteria bacterium]
MCPVSPQKDSRATSPREKAPFASPSLTSAVTTELFFQKGIIGFGDHQRYLLAPTPKTELWPMKVLVHQQNPSLFFLVIEDKGLDETHHLTLNPSVFKSFGYDEMQTRIFFIVTTALSEEAGQKVLLLSVNKKAPLFIDCAGKRAGQHILGDKNLPLCCPLPAYSKLLQDRLNLK